jgi:dienelactone hydrolase
LASVGERLAPPTRAAGNGGIVTTRERGDMMTKLNHPRPPGATRLISLLIAVAITVSAFAAVATTGRAQNATPLASPMATPLSGAVERVPLTIDFGDFESAAELTYPATGDGPFPTVILIPGSGPYDMDFTIRDFQTGEVRSTIFIDIANYLSANGYAVLRCNKHYVTGSDEMTDAQTYYQNFTFDMLLTDARAVYETARERPEVDPDRIALYGWSEGAPIAVQLALSEPEVAALILQGPAAEQFKEIFTYQNRVLGVRFLTEIADAGQDGQVSLDELFGAAAQYPGTVTGFAILISLDLTGSQTDAPQLNPEVDTNEDGLLDIDGEVIPYLDDFFANFDELSASGGTLYGPQYASDQKFPPVLETIVDVPQPILIIHGEEDANVSPELSERVEAALAEAGHPDHTLILYPGLGHSLGPAETVFDDNFAPISSEPLADVLAWLDARLGDD